VLVEDIKDIFYGISDVTGGIRIFPPIRKKRNQADNQQQRENYY